MQMLFAKLFRRSENIQILFNSSQKLLFYKGIYLESSMEKESVTKEEIPASIHHEKIGNADDVLAVVIEPNGNSVIKI